MDGQSEVRFGMAGFGQVRFGIVARFGLARSGEVGCGMVGQGKALYEKKTPSERRALTVTGGSTD